MNHYTEAEFLLNEALSDNDYYSSEQRDRYIAAAQVHATLALFQAQATILVGEKES